MVGVDHPMARSFVLPERPGEEARSSVAERFEIMPDQSLPASDPRVAARRDQLKVEIGLMDEARLNEATCFMRDLPQHREMVVCGRCVLSYGAASPVICPTLCFYCRPVPSDGYVESGPLNPGGFVMTDADTDAVVARRHDFMQRLDAVFGDRVPPSKRRLFDRSGCSIDSTGTFRTTAALALLSGHCGACVRALATSMRSGVSSPNCCLPSGVTIPNAFT